MLKSSMDKKTIKETLLNRLNNEIAGFSEIASSTKDYANSESVKSDGKYDTRGVEAGYLAGAQLKRLEELKLEKKLIEDIELQSFSSNDEIKIGALLEIEFNNTKKKYFLSSTAGGSMLKINEEVILVISVFSPIGAEVVGLKSKDEFEIDFKGEIRSYKIVSVS